MLALEIVLIISGLFFFTLSFFVTEKLSDSDIEYIKKLSEKEVNAILQKELENASDKIQSKIDEKTEDAILKIETETDKDTDNKLLSIGEYGDTVIKNFNENSEKTLESVNKSHDQITFIYSMLSDKEKKIDKLSKKLEYEEDYLRALKTSVEEKAEELKKLNIEVTSGDVEKAKPINRKNENEDSSYDDEDSNSAVVKYRASKNSRKNAGAEENINADDSINAKENIDAGEGIEADENINSDETRISDIADLKVAFEKEISDEKSESENNSGETSINDKVIALYKQGYSEVEIAKSLGKGVGEVKLILGLFDKVHKS